jgi:hypothetical protein
MSAAAQPTKELFNKTKSVNLGEVDAFISHSWSDDGDAKFDRLQEWAAEKNEKVETAGAGASVLSRSVADASVEKLADAEAKGKRLRLRVSGALVQLAWMLALLSMISALYYEYPGVDLTLVAGNPITYFAGLPWACALFVLALRPTDAKGVPIACAVAFLFFVGFTAVLSCIYWVATQYTESGGPLLVGLVIVAIVCLMIAALLWPTLNVRLPCCAKADKARLAELMELAKAEAEQAKAEKVAAEVMTRAGAPGMVTADGKGGSNGLNGVTIWLDKACLDQSDITASLEGLPVFLAGCKQLLVLAGPTYASRLWCVMEIFIFVRMGGEHENMVVRLLSGATDLAPELLKFDAGKAKTFDPNDRERLWAVIEAAFGTFDPFNKVVRDMFNKKLDRPCHSQLLSDPDELQS